MEGNQAVLKGKIVITGILTVKTGLHIGVGSDYAPIGAVDSPFVRDPLTHAPIIPGSSLKGKLRILLAKNRAKGYILNSLEQDDAVIARLFGMAGKDKVRPARLQFYDLFVTEESQELFTSLDTDTYMGEIKFENTINRHSGAANPRQIERVPAGMKFRLKLVYNIELEQKKQENQQNDGITDIKQDLQALEEGLDLLEYDYLGGHGSRGYGRVEFSDLTYSYKFLGETASIESDLDECFTSLRFKKSK